MLFVFRNWCPEARASVHLLQNLVRALALRFNPAPSCSPISVTPTGSIKQISSLRRTMLRLTDVGVNVTATTGARPGRSSVSRQGRVWRDPVYYTSLNLKFGFLQSRGKVRRQASKSVRACAVQEPG